MFKTIGFGLIVSSIVVVISWVIGYMLIVSFRKAYVVLVILLGLIMIPSYLHAYLWLNTIYKLLGINVMSGLFMSVIVQSMYLLPLATLLWYLYLRQINGEYLDETTLGISLAKARMMTYYTMSKSIVGIIFGLVFILAITDFTIPSIFAFNTFPIEIMAVFSSQSFIAVPLLISIPMVLITVAIFILISRSYRLKITSDDLLHNEVIKGKVNPITNFILMVILGGIALPFLLMFIEVIRDKDMLSVIYQYRNDYIFTMVTSVITSIVIVLISYLLNYYLILKKEYEKYVFLLLIIVFSVPNTILGLLVNGFYIKVIDLIPSAEWLYYSYIPTIHLYVIKFLPIGFWVMYTGFTSISKEKIVRARLNSNNTFRILRFSTLYGLKEFIVVSFFVNMVLSIGELGGSIMVVPPGAITITITIYNYLHYGSTDIVSVLSFAVTVMIISLVLLMLKLIKTIH